MTSKNNAEHLQREPALFFSIFFMRRCSSEADSLQKWQKTSNIWANRKNQIFHNFFIILIIFLSLFLKCRKAWVKLNTKAKTFHACLPLTYALKKLGSMNYTYHWSVKCLQYLSWTRAYSNLQKCTFSAQSHVFFARWHNFKMNQNGLVLSC